MFVREWRNWQTRTFEGRVVTPYGFKSRFSHQEKQVVDLLFHFAWKTTIFDNAVIAILFTFMEFGVH